MNLPADLTTHELGELGMRMAIMTRAELRELADQHPEWLRAGGVLMAMAARFIEGDEGHAEG